MFSQKPGSLYQEREKKLESKDQENTGEKNGGFNNSLIQRRNILFAHIC